jgi:phage recombination protein Bet
MVCLVLDYCKARRLDPLLKPVHIVKTWDDEQRQMVETIWPGINLHRTIASRTREHAGKDAPIFGPNITQAVGDVQITFPEWCEVTVRRLVGGKPRAFTSRVYWLETFGKKKSGSPNSMWIKRKMGQLAKCAEADALRSAFPEELGGLPVIEEAGATATMDADFEESAPRAPQAAPAALLKPSKLDALVAKSEAAKPQLGMSGNWKSGSESKTEGTRFPVKNSAGDVRWFSDAKSWSAAMIFCLSETILPDEVWDANQNVHTWFMQQKNLDEESISALQDVVNYMRSLLDQMKDGNS